MKTGKETPENLRQFVGTLSHQLKSPISSIQSMLKTVADGFTGDLNDKTRYFIEKAIHKTAEANALIADLLHYQLYGGGKSDRHQNADLVSVIRSMTGQYAAESSDKELVLRVRVPEKTEVVISGDPKALEIVLKNLLENAIKYTPPHGHILVKLTVKPSGKSCLLQVSDSGEGIPEKELRHIFDPFYRSLKHRAAASGTGLGLSITRSIIQGMKGSVSVTSKEGGGTVFNITFPVVRVREHADASGRRRRVLIIGGVTAGPKAAARLRRLDETLDITIIDKGEFLSYSGCGLPSYISGKVFSPKGLMSTADNTIRDIHFFETNRNIKMLNKTEALSVNRRKKTVKLRDLATREIWDIPYDILVLATGADSFLPDIPGIRLPGIYSLHRVEDAEAIKKECAGRNARDVFIIGGGLIGVETSESLIEAGARVTILEKQPHILSTLFDEDFSQKIQNALKKKGIKFITEVSIKSIVRSGEQLVFSTNKGRFYADLVILSAGVVPNTLLAKKAGLALTAKGAIRVNDHLLTSDKHIYAIGDCAGSVNNITGTQEYWPLGSISTKMGRIAADNICGRPSKFQGFVGTVVFQSFGLNIARTGLTLDCAERNGFRAEAVVITGLDRAHYVKNAEVVTFKLIADRKTGVILGAQAYGRGDAVRHIQIIACAIAKSMTLTEVFSLDLGYAPAFNNPIDIVQTACSMLAGKMEGFLKTVTLKDMEGEMAKAHLIDVSPVSDHVMNAIPGSINVPLENLRSEGVAFEKGAACILYSKNSSRAYEAYRYLITRGYTRVFVLEGGFIYWKQ